MSAWVRIALADGTVKTFDLHPLPRSGVREAAAIEFDGALLLRNTRTGRLYGGGRLPTGNTAYVGWTWHWLPRLARCLCHLGAITKEDEAATVAAYEAAVAETDRKHKVSDFKRAAEALGIDVSKQLQKLGVSGDE